MLLDVDDLDVKEVRRRSNKINAVIRAKRFYGDSWSNSYYVITDIRNKIYIPYEHVFLTPE